MLGDSSVGKTSLLLRFVMDKFDNNFTTTLGINFKEKVVEINNRKIVS